MKEKKSLPQFSIQNSFKILGYLVVGIIFSGTILDAIGNSISLITPPITYGCTAIIAIIWGGLELQAIRYRIKWKKNGQILNIKQLGLMPRLFFLGVLITLYIPIVYVQPNNSSSLPPEVSKEFKEILKEKDIEIDQKDQTIVKMTSQYKKLLSELNSIKWIEETEGDFIHNFKEGNFEEAEIQLLRMLDYHEDKINQSTIKKAEILFKIGQVKEMLLEYEEASNYYKQSTLLDSTNVFNMLIYGNLLFEISDFDEAEIVFSKAHKTAIKQYGVRDTITSECLNNLGTIFIVEGKYRKAITLLKEAIEINEYIRNPSEALAENYTNLSEVYRYLENFKESEKWGTRALNIFRDLFGEFNVDVADLYDNIGVIKLQQNQFDGAFMFQKDALRIRKKILKPNHPDISLSYNNIAATYFYTGNFEDALLAFKAAYNIRKNIYPEPHWSIAQSLSNMGKTKRVLGKTKAAKQDITLALKYFQDLYGEKNIDIANTKNNLGEVECDLGNFKKGIELSSDALDISMEIFGTDNFISAKCHLNLANAFAKLKNFELAEEHCQKGLEYFLSKYGDNSPFTGESYFILGNIQSKYSKDSAIQNYKDAIEIFTRYYGENHPKINEIKKRIFKVQERQNNL